MTEDEKKKAIDALKMSVPFVPLTREEFDDYIKTLNKIMNWLEQDPCDEAISREEVLDTIARVGLWKKDIKEVKTVSECLRAVEKLQPVKQKPETVTEFADRCRECGAKYGKLFDQKTGHWNITFLIHKELEIPIYEAQKAYEVAIDYLRSQAYVRG